MLFSIPIQSRRLYTNRFNVAEIGAMSRDIPHEAKILVKRMRSDPNVDLKRHWKCKCHIISAR